MSNPSTTNLTCLILCLILACFQGCSPDPSVKAAAQAASGERRIPVTTMPLAERPFEERISIQGTLVAKHSAMVAPRVDGIITDMFVEEGDFVEANKTPLFQSDKLILTQAFEIAQRDKAVATCARLEAEAQVVAAQAQYEKAKLDYDRFLRLREQQAVTPDAMEQMEAGFAVAKAQVERAQTGVRLRTEQEKQTEAALEIANKRLHDSLIYSPIDGWISYRGKKAGEFSGAGTPILRIANTRVLEVSAFLPGEYYPRLIVNETRIRVRVSNMDLGLYPVSYKSPEINDQLRTFEVKCVIDSPPEGVVAGAIAQVDAVLETRTAIGAPQDAVVVRDGRSTIFVLEDAHARAVPVRTGISAEGWIEIVEGAPDPGTPVIVSGQHLVNDGGPVSALEEGR